MNSHTVFYSLILFAITLSCTHPTSKNPENWSERELEKWIQTGDWKLGWDISPDQSINTRELAIRYFENQERWAKAFNYLKTNNLEKISVGRYELDGANLVVNVDEYTTKNEEDSRFEAHKKTIGQPMTTCCRNISDLGNG